MVATPRQGFTLMEAMVAMLLSSVVVILVSTVFLVQNQYYALQVERSAAQDNARMVTEMVASEIRSVMQGGVVIAENERLVVRTPVVLGVVCDKQGGNKSIVQLEGGWSSLDTDDLSGFAVRDTLTGAWSYYDISNWNSITNPGGQPARDCYDNGADTVGAYNQFYRFQKLDDYYGSDPAEGQVLMFYRNVEYEFATSELDPTTTALFRGLYGGTLVEFATGMDTSSAFAYRTGGSSYATSVTGGSLSAIDAVRIIAQSRRKPQTGGVDDVTYGWAVNVILRNGS